MVRVIISYEAYHSLAGLSNVMLDQESPRAVWHSSAVVGRANRPSEQPDGLGRDTMFISVHRSSNSFTPLLGSSDTSYLRPISSGTSDTWAKLPSLDLPSYESVTRKWDHTTARYVVPLGCLTIRIRVINPLYEAYQTAHEIIWGGVET
ncbi:hypothetical protein RRF57_005626 [Xylaria bambusicola]|uniref:Uncharacterized protein n=1 Tax=Xylaria bambusicola TaxID=326684 RepID=A0AAN7UNW7_9PEZI